MAYRIDMTPEARDDLRDLRAYVRAKVEDHIDQFLTTSPTAIGPVRIKQYQMLEPPYYRLRVDDWRVHLRS